MIDLYSIEARSFNLVGVGSHNYWVLRNGVGDDIAELHGLATDRETGRWLPIGVIDDSLRAWSFATASSATEIGINKPIYSSSGYINPGQKSEVVFVGGSADVFARWRQAASAVDMINRLDLDYPAFGVNILSDTVNSNSMFRTFGALMGVEFDNFPWVIEPGIDNFVIPADVLDVLKYSYGPTVSPMDKLIDAESELRSAREKGEVSQSVFEKLSSWFSDVFSGVLDFFGFGSSSPKPGTGGNSADQKPIGAFYDSQSAASDTAASIADKTFMLFDENHQAVTAARFAAFDTDADGQLSGDELAFLSMWADANENGHIDNGEMSSLAESEIQRIRFEGMQLNTSVNGFAGLQAAEGNPPAEAGVFAEVEAANSQKVQMVADASSRYVLGGASDDVIWGHAGGTTLFGNAGDDDIYGGAGRDRLTGDAGNDRLFGGDGADNMTGGSGDDYLLGEAGDDQLRGGEGSDTLFGGEGADQLVGEKGNDRLIGGSGNDRFWGGGGDDTLWGGDGDDILAGFTAPNDSKQTLEAGETDNDTIYGGDGQDNIAGGLGNDRLFGDAGNDRLFGQVGDDLLYGGDGDDLLFGFTGTDEAKQTVAFGESDNDWLYGGAGRDTLVGGLGDDYLDGGAGADVMQGGLGDDTYVVNSVNDSILELRGEGYDRVMSGTTYLLNANIEELRLFEGLDIHGTGNALDNLLIGNDRDNILDGVTGADRMVGGAGDDVYYVDNVGDQTVEHASEGNDTVQASISHTLANNLENLVLLDFAKGEKGVVDGQASVVYGFPKANELDYMQGDALLGYRGTCGIVSIANLLTQVDRPTSEGELLEMALEKGWVERELFPRFALSSSGSTSVVEQQAMLESFGVRNEVITGYNETGTANLLRSGRGVVQAVNAGALWGDPKYVNSGSANHMVTVTGVAYNEASGELLGFYIADSGRQKVSDMTRFVSLDLFRQAANVSGAYAIFTLEPLKLWDENINATGNDQDNVLVGNRGDNVLIGGAGNDVLEGQGGNDVLDGGAGDDTLNGGAGSNTYLFGRGYGHDTVSSEAALAAETERYVLFLEAIGANDLWFSRAANNLDVSIVSTQDTLTISDWFTDPNNQNTTFQTSDGDALTAAKVNCLIEAMAAFAPPSSASSSLPPNYQAALEPVLAASWG